ncbi:MAG: TrmH family RNA methyltransferase [Paraglaciecola sp.]|jgi:TrmH family RNA methyltransferase
MLSINQQKYLRSLTQKKFRDKHNVFTVEGEKIVQEVLENEYFTVKKIFGLVDWFNQNRQLLTGREYLFNKVSDKELRQISTLSTPNQVFVVVEKPAADFQKELLYGQYALYLDNIQDPGNLGTIWRIADWFGFAYVFCSKGCVDWSNPKVIQSSMGAFLRVKILQKSFFDLKNEVPDVPTYAAVLGGENIFETTFTKNGIVIIGNESKGISEELQNAATFKIAIPKGQNGGAESLNAAVATGIICGQLAMSN